jgi:inosose dehydratase
MTSSLRFGCQTYSWQMSLPRYRGEVDRMAAAAARAGFTGFEPEVVMLGEDWTEHTLLGPLTAHGLRLAALVHVERWQDRYETAEEARRADLAINLVSGVPGAILNLVQYPGEHRADLSSRQRNALSCLAAIAARAHARGVHCTFHPNSPPGSVFRTPEDYNVLLDGLPPQVGFTPDTGHLVRGGLDPLEVIRTYRSRVDHVHWKDVSADGTWAPTGLGIIDFHAIAAYLVDTGYDGWVVMEDESEQARLDPDGAALRNGEFACALVTGLVTS